MKRSFILLSASLLWIVPSAFAQLPPLGPPQKPAAEAAAAPAASLSVDAANADLKIARAANQEKRYADAEALMLKDTAARPGLPYLWIELGLAQLSQKKYAEAEASFKAALSGGESAQKTAPAGGFYVPGKGTASHVSISSAPPPPTGKNNHEVEGIANSSLGEVYIRTNRAAEAQAAFDQAVKDNPTQAALYLRNETIFFLQTGNAAAQVEAANKSLAIDPGRAALYFYKGQGLAAQATLDPKTQKLVLPTGCAEALQKYLDMEPVGPYATDAKGMLAAAGVAIKAGKK